MRVLICGGRMFGRVPPDCPPEDYAREKARATRQQSQLRAALDRLHAERRFSLVIHGAAMGADRLAGRWAEWKGLPVQSYPITSLDWQRWGHAAGPIRNERMLVEGRPALVVAFAGSAGTQDMVRRALAAGVEVVKP